MRYLYFLFVILLAGCTGGAVRFAPTPQPPDISPIMYQHPGDVFSLILPRNWSVFTQNLTTLATASFSPPGDYEPTLSVAVVNLGRTINAEDLGGLMFQYQTEIRPDLARYKEQDRQAMGDGSWRLTGLREATDGITHQINTFVQRHERFLVIIEVLLPVDPSRQAEIQSIINTLEINTSADLPVGDLNLLGAASAANIEILNVKAWTTPDSVFFITGEVTNRGTQPMSNIPVKATLWSADGTGLAEAVDIIMGFTLFPGSFAPFSLRFGKGQPPETNEYILSIGSENWQPDEAVAVVGANAMTWTDQTSYNENGHLIVSGTITNTSDETILNPRAVVTVFDEEQFVIAAGFADASVSELEPEQNADYVILIPDMGGTPTNYIVTVQGLPEG